MHITAEGLTQPNEMQMLQRVCQDLQPVREGKGTAGPLDSTRCLEGKMGKKSTLFTLCSSMTFASRCWLALAYSVRGNLAARARCFSNRSEYSSLGFWSIWSSAFLREQNLCLQRLGMCMMRLAVYSVDSHRRLVWR